MTADGPPAANGGGEQRRAVVVAVASDAVQAAIWRDALEDAGIAAAVVERGVGAALGGANTVSGTFPLLVDRDQLAAARNIVAELGGAVALAPFPDDVATGRQRRRALLVAGAIVAVIVVLGVLSRLFAG